MYQAIGFDLGETLVHYLPIVSYLFLMFCFVPLLMSAGNPGRIRIGQKNRFLKFPLLLYGG